jgi:hypothetical protein
MAGKVEKWLNPIVLRRIYRQELRLICDYVQKN